MRLNALFTTLLGTLVAGGAVLYTNILMKSPEPKQAMVNIVVASEDIGFGDAIDMDKLALRLWPADAVPDGAFSSVEPVIGDDDDEPRRARNTITKGEVLIANKLSEFGDQVSITQMIDPRMRAVTIRVNDVTGVAGFIAPSDRIDLTLTRTIDQGLTTSTILQDVQVIGIDQKTDNARSEPATVKTVTVQVKPADAQKLALAQQAGTLSLSLRHIDAADQPVLDSISVGDLTDPAKPKPKITKTGLPSIVVNRRGERSTVEVPSG